MTTRKLTGAQRIAPIREKLARILALTDAEDGDDDLFTVAHEAQRAGFPQLAREALALGCDRIGCKPCFECMSALGSYRRDGRQCDACKVHAKERQQKSKTKRVRPSVWNQSRLRMCHTCGRPARKYKYECGECFSERWPWLRVGRGQHVRWVLMRKWKHLQGQLPDPNDYRNQVDSREIAAILEADRARRSAA